MIQNDILKVLYSKEELAQRTTELGKELTEDYRNKKPLLVGILKGAIFFTTDLAKAMDINVEIDFMDVSSYGNSTISSGAVKIIKDLSASAADREIIIVEDIIDSGRTLEYLVSLFKRRGANTVKLVTLLDKPEGRVVDIKADYVGFLVPNEFVVGYGIDFAERYRNLPYVAVLKPEMYQ